MNHRLDQYTYFDEKGKLNLSKAGIKIFGKDYLEKNETRNSKSSRGDRRKHSSDKDKIRSGC